MLSLLYTVLIRVCRVKKPKDPQSSPSRQKAVPLPLLVVPTPECKFASPIGKSPCPLGQISSPETSNGSSLLTAKEEDVKEEEDLEDEEEEEGCLYIATAASDVSSKKQQQQDSTLDYVINGNGSCTCKLCGEVVPSRTHWYRHKYKVNSSTLLTNCS